jgi:hypothetical protein
MKIRRHGHIQNFSEGKVPIQDESYSKNIFWFVIKYIFYKMLYDEEDIAAKANEYLNDEPTVT